MIYIDIYNYIGIKNGAGGSGVFIEHFIRELQKNNAFQFRVIKKPQTESLFSNVSLQPDQVLEVKPEDDRWRTLAKLVRRDDVLFCPFTDVPDHRMFPQGFKIVSMVHDLQHIDQPLNFPVQENLNRQEMYFRVANHASKVLFIAESQRELFHENFAFGREDTAVFGHGAYLYETYADHRHQIDVLVPKVKKWLGDFLLFPAVDWPHKGHALLYAVLSAYNRKHPQTPVKIITAGARLGGWHSDALIDLREKLGLDERQHLDLGVLNNTELASLFAASCGVVFPSLYEGYGIPVREALMFGKPVLSFDLAEYADCADNLTRVSKQGFLQTFEEFVAAAIRQHSVPSDTDFSLNIAGIVKWIEQDVVIDSSVKSYNVSSGAEYFKGVHYSNQIEEGRTKIGNYCAGGISISKSKSGGNRVELMHRNRSFNFGVFAADEAKYLNDYYTTLFSHNYSKVKS